MTPIELRPQMSSELSAGFATDRKSRASSVSLRRVSKRFGSDLALDNIDLDIAAGEFVALIGPSGCGKSTLLRLIAGLEEADVGALRIGGTVVTDQPAQARDLAMVFQHYALYPHLTVYRNLALSLEVRKVAREIVEQRVERAAAMLDISYLLNRRPGLLSGGQRQRVALARALVRGAPLFLLDEPLSNLDVQQRRALRAEIVSLHRQLGATFIYATHDQTEAMGMAERVVVMNAGRIEQAGTPDELHDHPASAFVANFLRVDPSLAELADRARQAASRVGRDRLS